VKRLIAFLLVIIALLQYRLWLGDGGIAEWHELQVRIEELKAEGEHRKARNAALDADVRDLKEGTDAIEERARQELGMIRAGETFVQVFEKPHPQTQPSQVQPETEKPPAPAETKPSKKDKRHR
jgi:cell division protein FtsB